MGSAIGWYGPLIDLNTASSHIGDFVQLLVFVHRSFTVQCKSSKRGRDLTRIDVEVGDDTTPFFMVSLWQSHMGSVLSPGDIVFLQNFKIAKYGDAVEARTVLWSSLHCLVHPYQSLLSKAAEELVTGCHVGTSTKNKLKRVIKWVQQSQSTTCNIKLQSNQQIENLPRNWTMFEDKKPRDCFSLIEVSQLTTSCKARVCASIGEIVPLRTARILGDTMKEKIYISRRVYTTGDNNLVDDLLCIGCQLCGSPLDSKFEQNAVPLICWKNSSRLHSICSIYRPFMLYIWDESDYMPFLVKNKAAEILFGNIKGEKVYSAYKEQMHNQNLGPRNECKDKDATERLASNPRLAGVGLVSANTLEVGKSLQSKEKHLPDNFNFYRVWLILLRMLLKQGKNSPLKFEIIVDPSLDIENGKFEMVSATMPCFGSK